MSSPDHAESSTNLGAADVLDALRTVEDPEAPISIVDLGLVEACRVGPDGSVEVDLVPTRSSCPAKEFIAARVVERITAAFAGRRVQVRWLPGAVWSTTRIRETGGRALRELGIAVPVRDEHGRTTTCCPYCGSDRVTRDARFGASVCRAIWYCAGCRNPFEEMRWTDAGPEAHP